MRTAMTNVRRPAYYTVQEAAWVLGVEQSHVSRAIRLGTLRTVRRRGRLMIPASALTRLLAVRAERDQPSGHDPQSVRTP